MLIAYHNYEKKKVMPTCAETKTYNGVLLTEKYEIKRYKIEISHFYSQIRLSVMGWLILTLSQTRNFRLFQTGRVHRQQF